MISATKEMLEKMLAETRRTADRQRILKQLHKLRKPEKKPAAAK